MKVIENKGFAVVLLFLISFGVFAPSLMNGFVYDDIRLIEKRYQGLDTPEVKIKKFIPSPKTPKSRYYRPLLKTSFVIDHEIWGLSTFGFHFTNNFLYALSTVLVYFFALLLFREFNVNNIRVNAFVSALFFALHPVHVEAVSFISGRSDLICSIFFLMAFMFHLLSYRRLFFLFFSALSFCLALLSKEVAVSFILAVIAFDLISRRFVCRANILRYSIYGILLLIYFYLMSRGYEIITQLSPEKISPPNPPVDVSSGEIVQQSFQFLHQSWQIISVILSSIYLYIKKLILPFNLNPLITTVPGGIYIVALSIITLLLLLVACFISIRRREGISSFCILWILATITPALPVAIFEYGLAPVAERFLYIPSAGFCVLIGYLIIEIGGRLSNPRLSWVVVFIVCLSYLVITVKGQAVWKDDLTFWGYIVKKSPNAAVVHLNYGNALRRVGRMDEALEQFYIAAGPDTDSKSPVKKSAAAHNVGVMYMKKGDFARAEEWFRKALDYNSENKSSYYLNMGTLYFLKGETKLKLNDKDSITDYQESIKYLEKLLIMLPCNGHSRLLLARVYIRLGENGKAKRNLEIALECGRLNWKSYNAALVLLNKLDQ